MLCDATKINVFKLKKNKQTNNESIEGIESLWHSDFSLGEL